MDGGVLGLGALTMKCGNGLRKMVTGRIQDYITYTMLGMGVLLILLILSM